MVHGVVATNVWRARIAANIDASCTCRAAGTMESLLHRFHHCPLTLHAWQFVKTLLYMFVNIPPNVAGDWPDLTWQQCVLGSPLPKRLQKRSKAWSLLRGSILWLTWIACNVVCFHADPWEQAKMEHAIWDALNDHARAAWTHCVTCIKLYPASTAKFLQRFDDT
jgi:hypothetical protein